MIETIYGYLEAAYLMGPYLSAVVTGAIPGQMTPTVMDSMTVPFQIHAKVSVIDAVKTELHSRIDSGLGVVLSQIDAKTVHEPTTIKMQIAAGISDDSRVPIQLDQLIGSEARFLGQMEFKIVPDGVPVPMQIAAVAHVGRAVWQQLGSHLQNQAKSFHLELGRGPVSQQICGGYLLDPYLEEPYLVQFICGHLRNQITSSIGTSSLLHGQLDRRIATTPLKHVGMQLNRKIVSTRPIPMQILRTSIQKLNTQLLFAIYNTHNIRILYLFPSRGTTGENWSVIAGGQAPGDRGINNVNTDIVEQVYRSTAPVITIQCDTEIPQGIFNDTLGILNHNLTNSAVVTLQASNDVSFSSVPFSEQLTVEQENIYWISPTLPTVSYRYWRIDVSDVTNPNGYIQIGTIVFGSAIIFAGECFTDEVVRRKTHFADRIRTEGYSAISNDRALKRAVGLQFRMLNNNRENFESLMRAVDYVRTSLKALWIPTPRYASRYAVFGKLAEMPVENHKSLAENADWVNFDINVDEAL